MNSAEKRVKSKEDILKVLEEEGYSLSTSASYYLSRDCGINFNIEMFNCCDKTMDERCKGGRGVVGEWTWKTSWLEDAKSEIEKAHEIWVKKQEGRK